MTTANVDAERRAASGVRIGEDGLRIIVYDTTVTIPSEASANKSSRWPGARGRQMMHSFGRYGMYQAYSPGVRLNRARMTIALRVCRHWRATEAYAAYRPLDLDNLQRACKGLIDGIVKAGLLPDDRAQYLEHGTYALIEVGSPWEEGLRVTIEELPA